MFTEDEINTYRKIYDRLCEFAEEYVDEFGFNKPSVESVELEDGIVSVTVSEGCMGHYEPGWYSFPVEYLWDPYWAQTEKDKRREENMQALKKKAEEKKKEKEEAERKEYEHFLELKAKYSKPIEDLSHTIEFDDDEEDDDEYPCPPHSNSRNCV